MEISIKRPEPDDGPQPDAAFWHLGWLCSASTYSPEVTTDIQQHIRLQLMGIVRCSPDTRRWAVASVNTRMAVMER